MKDFKQHILEKLKVNSNKNYDPRDYETVDMLSANASDKCKFHEYLQDCLKRDKYDIQSSDFDFHNNKVLYYYDKYMRSLCDYSVNDTYIELYDRIIDTLKEDHFIHEKLKISPNNTDNYVFKTKQVNLNNFEKFGSYMLDNRTFELFYDYFYCRITADLNQNYIKDNNITYDSIYLDYDGEDTFVLDNDSGDEIMKSEGFNPEYFYVCYSNIIDYFEDKNI